MVDIDPLIKSIKLNIKQLCSSPDYDKATAFYNPLLKQLSKMTHIGTEAEEAKRFKSMIVTTNYDIPSKKPLSHAVQTTMMGSRLTKPERFLFFQKVGLKYQAYRAASIWLRFMDRW